MSDGEEEHCRICRCGVEDGELFHPCTCRGSVKYVHSDCLKQWLASSKRERICDICKTPYKFEPLIPDDAPENINSFIVFTELVVRRIISYFRKYAGLVIGSFLFVIIFPMTLIASVRFYSLLIDGKMPKQNILLSIIAGNLSTVGNSFQFNWNNIFQCMKYGYPTGLKLVAVIVVTVLQSVILHEWVTKDEGFENLMNLRIGDEKVSNYVDLFIRDFLQETFRSGVNNARINRHELERLIELHELSFRVQARNIALIDVGDDQLEREYERARVLAFNNIVKVIPFILELEPVDPSNPEQPIIVNENFEAPNIANNNNFNQVAAANIPPIDAEEIIAALEEEEEEDDDDDEAAGLGFGFNIHVEIQGGVKIFAAAMAIFLVALVFIYYLPSAVGIILFKAIYATVSMGLAHLFESKYFKDVNFSNKWIDMAVEYLKPLTEELSAVFNDQFPVSFTGRIIPLLTDISTFYVFSSITMYFLEKSYRSKLVALRGFKRKFYYILFDFRSVLKVNVIFATEIVVFPVFCGLLLDFVSSPIFVEDSNFISWNKLFTSSLFYNVLKTDRFFIFITYWAAGTVYMCLFATYVGMIRKYILRPGVLFFIRSPDDQNTRLIHDALVRPFGLQMSRIFLSGAVYTAFILVGFGVITFPMRYFSAVLPVKFNLVSTFTISSAAVLNFKLYKILVPALRKYVRIYWFYAIRKAAHMTRISSFILGINDINERGKIVHKSLFHLIFARQDPDYNNPIAEDDLNTYFESNPSASSLFVPDGNWIKAPDNDNVSRLYLRHLFYPVRADGTDYEDIRPNRGSSKIDNLLGEKDEIDEIRSHTVVFRPPNFGIRNFLFVAILWFFAAILILGIILSANLMGVPVSRTISYVGTYLPNWTLNLICLGYFDDHKADSVLQLSYSSIIFGLVIELAILKKFDKSVKINRIQLLNKGRPLLEEPDDDMLDEDATNYFEIVKTTANFALRSLIIIGSFSIWGLFIIMIHKYLLVAILSPEGLTKDIIIDDFYKLKKVDYSEFSPLLKQFGTTLITTVKNMSISGITIQSTVASFTIIPFMLSINSTQEQSLARFKQFMKPHLSAVIYLALYSVYHTASVLPGLTGNLSSTQWEISFGFALVIYMYKEFSVFYNEVILKNKDEIRKLYYATGERLMNHYE